MKTLTCWRVLSWMHNSDVVMIYPTVALCWSSVPFMLLSSQFFRHFNFHLIWLHVADSQPQLPKGNWKSHFKPLHSSFYPLNWWRIAPHGLSRQLPPFFGRLKRRGPYILNFSCDLEWTLLIWSWTLSPRSSCECDCHGKRVFATVFARLTRSHHPLPMCSLGYF